MAKISTYPVSASQANFDSLLIGSEVGDYNATKNYKISDLFLLTARAEFESTINQTLLGANIATPVRWTSGSPVVTNAFSVNNGTGLETAISTGREAYYSLNFLPQFFKATSGNVNVDVWIRINGTNVVGSNRTIVVTGGGVYTCANFQYFMYLESGMPLEVFWASSDTGVSLSLSGATGVHPSGYSAFALISQI